MLTGMLWGLERCENEQLTPRAWYPTTAHVVGELEPVRPRVRPLRKTLHRPGTWLE